MTYWEYRREKNREFWHNFLDWWMEYGFLFLMLGWMIPIMGGALLTLVSGILGLIIMLIGVVWVFLFLGYIAVDSELEDFRNWKKRVADKNTGGEK